MAALVRPMAAAPSRDGRRQLRCAVAGTAALLLGVALLAVAAPGSLYKTELTGSNANTPGVTASNEAVVITTQDVNNANAQVASDLNSLETEQAGSVMGSIPTDEVEANAIIGNMDHYVRTMGDPYHSLTGPHNDIQAEADAIIGYANKENMDVTGKAGATIYEVASDATAPASAWLRGSVPNYRAESAYITSGVDGNYEKSLENGPTMSVVGGKVSARQVAYEIIDEAYKDRTSPDCTGSVDSAGEHGVGKGTPPCTATVAFKKPKNMAGSGGPLSKIWVNVTLDMSSQTRLAGSGKCDDETKARVKSALAEAAGVGSSDVIFPEPPGGSDDIRLVDCNEEGCCRVEILHDDEWGTVCDDRTTDVFATVACNQAGCPGAGTVVDSFGSEYSAGEGIIWLDDVECIGLEDKVQDCPHSDEGWNIDDCDHGEDVGVCCADGCGPSAEPASEKGQTAGLKQSKNAKSMLHGKAKAAKPLLNKMQQMKTQESAAQTQRQAAKVVEARAKRQANDAFMSGVHAAEEKNLAAEMSKVQEQLAQLESNPHGNLAEAESKALKGDSLFERKLAAAALQLELSQHKLLQKAAKQAVAKDAQAVYESQKDSLLHNKDPFYWVHTPAADEKAEPAQLKQVGRRLLQEAETGCKYEAYILVPTSDSFDANVNTAKKTSIAMVKRGLMPALSVTTSIEDIPEEEEAASER